METLVERRQKPDYYTGVDGYDVYTLLFKSLKELGHEVSITEDKTDDALLEVSLGQDVQQTMELYVLTIKTREFKILVDTLITRTDEPSEAIYESLKTLFPEHCNQIKTTSSLMALRKALPLEHGASPNDTTETALETVFMRLRENLGEALPLTPAQLGKIIFDLTEREQGKLKAQAPIGE